MAGLQAVTGAYGYSGKYIARQLLDAGEEVITLTNSTDRANEFGGRVRAYPLSFDRPDDLARALDGVEVLYNTYWVRFNHKNFTHADAVRNTLTLFDAAKRAGVGAGRAYQHHQPVGGLAAGVLQREGAAGARAGRVGAVARHPAADGAVRQGGHPDQ